MSLITTLMSIVSYNVGKSYSILIKLLFIIVVFILYSMFLWFFSEFLIGLIYVIILYIPGILYFYRRGVIERRRSHKPNL